MDGKYCIKLELLLKKKLMFIILYTAFFLHNLLSENVIKSNTSTHGVIAKQKRRITTLSCKNMDICLQRFKEK